MSTSLPFSLQCADDWEIFKDGDGTSAQSYNGTRLNVAAGAGAGRSYLRKRIPARPGDKITVKCMAFTNSGTPAISIDYPSSGAQKNEITFSQAEWKEYEVSYTVPYTADIASEFVQISIGVFTNDAGNVDIILPRVEVSEGVNGFARTVCMGLVSLVRSGGTTTASINKNYHHCGIISVNWNASTPALEIVTEKSYVGSEKMRPIFNVSLSVERAPEVSARVGQYNQATGQFLVKFTDGTTFVDINSYLLDGEGIYLFVHAAGI